MSTDKPELHVFEDLIIGRCCRDWPVVPPGQGGSCKLCGKRPQIIWEPYVGPLHKNEEEEAP